MAFRCSSRTVGHQRIVDLSALISKSQDRQHAEGHARFHPLVRAGPPPPSRRCSCSSVMVGVGDGFVKLDLQRRSATYHVRHPRGVAKGADF